MKYRLPPDESYNVKYTDDVDKYIAAWQSIYDPIEQFTGWRCYGFDPGLSFVRKDGSSGPSFSLAEAHDLCDAIRKVTG